MDSRELDAWLWEHLGFGEVVCAETLPAGPGIHKDEVGKPGPWYGVRSAKYEGGVYGWALSKVGVLSMYGLPYLSSTYEGMGMVEAAMRELGWELDLRTFLRPSFHAEANFWHYNDGGDAVDGHGEASNFSIATAVALAAKAALEDESNG